MDILERIEAVLYDKKPILEAYDYGIPNPAPGKTLEDLKQVRKPLDSGWTSEEIYSALKPTIISLANRYKTDTFSPDDAVSVAYDAITKAIQNDAGKSAFTSYVFPWLKTEMRRAAAKSSNVSGVPYSSGGKEDIYAGAKASVSGDAPIDDKGNNLMSKLADRSDLAQNDEKAAKAGSLLDKLLDLPAVELNDVEKNLLRTLGGLGGGEAKTIGQVAAEKGVSPARVSQIRAKAFAKIQDYLKFKGYNDPAIAARGLGLEHKIKLAAEAWLSIIKEMIEVELKMIDEDLNSAYYSDVISESIKSNDQMIINDL